MWDGHYLLLNSNCKGISHYQNSNHSLETNIMISFTLIVKHCNQRGHFARNIAARVARRHTAYFSTMHSQLGHIINNRKGGQKWPPFLF